MADPFAEYMVQNQAAPASSSGSDPFAEYMPQQAIEQPKPSRKDGILQKLSMREKSLAEKRPEAFRFYTGLRGTVDKGAQLLEAALPDAVNKGIDKFDKWAYENVPGGIIGQPAPSSEMRVARSESAKQLDSDGGTDWWQMGGAVADPAAWAVGAKAFQAAPALMSKGASAVPVLAKFINPVGKAANAGVRSGLTAAAVSGTSAPISEESVKEGLGSTLVETGGQMATAFPLGFVFGAAGQKLAQRSANKLASKMSDLDVEKAAMLKPDELAAVKQKIYGNLEKEGLKLSELPKEVLGAVDDYANKAVAYNASPDDVAQVTREAILKQVGARGTKGDITQNPVIQEAEQLSMSSDFGSKIRSLKEDQQVKLFSYLDKVKSSFGGDDLSEANFGRAIRDFVSGNYKAQKGKVSAAYKAAENELGGLPAELTEKELGWLAQNQGFPGVNGLLTQAKALGIVGTDDAGNIIANRTTFKNLAQLRSAASKMTKGGGQEAHYGGEFKGVIDDLFENYGGTLYKEAAKARRQQGLTYESGSKAISSLLKKAGGSETMPLIADEDVFKKVIVNMSNDEVSNLIKFANKNGGEKAIKNIQTQTTSFLKDAALGSGDGKYFNYSQFEKAIDKMGGFDKLKVIYGDDAVKEIQLVLKASKIANQAAPTFVKGSKTAGSAALMGRGLLKLLEKIPVVGSAAKLAEPKVQAALSTANALESPVRAMLPSAPVNALANKSASAASASLGLGSNRLAGKE